MNGLRFPVNSQLVQESHSSKEENMENTITVKDVMTTEVISVHPNDTVDKVSEIFKRNSFHHLPVIKDDRTVVGILSKMDYYKLMNTFTLFKTKKAEEYNEAIFRSLLVKEVMTKQIATLQLDDSIHIAIGMFKENLFHALPIVNEEKKLIGILSTYDLLNFAFK